MKKNLGSADRSVRVIAGLALLSLLVFLEGTARYLGLIGLVPLLTAAIGYCPLYGVFGLKTCPVKRVAAGMLLLAALGTSAYAITAPPKDFRAWTHVKSMVIPDKSHGLYGFHNVYANAAALPALKSGGTYKDGAAFVVSFYEVEVKDGMTMQGAKKMDTVMVKDRKAAKTGGWIFSAYGPDRKPLGIDPVKACYECHAGGAKASDLVFSKWIE